MSRGHETEMWAIHSSADNSRIAARPPTDPPDNTPLSDAELLSAFLSGDPYARDQLPRRFARRLRGLARALAPDLAEQGLDEDAVQRTWELLLGRPRLDYDRRVGAPIAYLGNLMRWAIRDVRAEHAPPGRRTRADRDRASRPVRLWLVPDYYVQVYGHEGRKVYVELIADRTDYISDTERRIEAHDLVRLAIRTAPLEVTRALAMIYLLGADLTRAAKTLGMSRGSLRRRIDEWVDARVRHTA